jgi:ATP phosphoribosyltransferase
MILLTRCSLISHSFNTPMSSPSSPSPLRFAIPKGRMQDGVLQLLSAASIKVEISDRGYRPTINLPNYHVKLLKPQNIIEMLHNGSRDVGFGGSDWVSNLSATNLVELLDTELDPVKIVVAGPNEKILQDACKPGGHITVASEYERLTRNWFSSVGLKESEQCDEQWTGGRATFVRAYGATESFPPEDADLIVDNTATGSTLKANGLMILDTILTSSTRLYANSEALKDPRKKQQIDQLVLLLKSVLLARRKCMITFNVESKELLDGMVGSLPCMRAPSVQQLYNSPGFAISICVDRKEIAELLPILKSKGAQDIIVGKVEQIVL